MWKVLLVDDEKTVTESLKKSIPWANLGVSTVLTASNGIQSIDILKKTAVDLIIADIQMPQMDGLQLLTEVRQLYPDIHCILLTAFSEFNYAIQALKLGVDNYLVKPIHFDELTETIENTLENIYLNRKNQETLFRENILRRWVCGTISADELGERSILIDINIYQPSYCVIVMRKKRASLSINTFCRTLNLKLQENYEIYSVWDNIGNYLILVGGKDICQKHLNQQINQVIETFDISKLVTIAIGLTVPDHMSVHISYQSACNLLTCATDNTILLCNKENVNPANKLLEIHTDTLSPVVKRAIEYINAHYAEGVSIKEFCHEININAAYLGCLFKKETGIYFNAYANELRIEKCIDLLCHTSKTIGDIALETGFTSASHFITSFKKRNGLSPLKYRETYGGGHRKS